LFFVCFSPYNRTRQILRTLAVIFLEVGPAIVVTALQHEFDVYPHAFTLIATPFIIIEVIVALE